MQCGVAPNPKKNANKREKHLNKKRGVRRGPLEVCENGVAKKKTGKDAKTLRTAAARAFFAMTPNSRENRHGHAPTARQICARTGQTAKNALSKTSSVLQPRGFFTPETNFVKISNFETYKIATRGKNYPQKRSAKSSLFDTPKGLKEVERREIAPKPLVL